MNPIRPSGSKPTPLVQLQRTLAGLLPPTSPAVKYILNKYRSVPPFPPASPSQTFQPPSPDQKITHLTTAYRHISESPPRPPGVPWSRENDAARYITTAISSLLTLLDKFRSAAGILAPYLREGWFDSSVYAWVLDGLFWGGRYPGLFLSRKEIMGFVPPPAQSAGEKYDGVFRFVDGEGAVLDLGVVEVSVVEPGGGPPGGRKSERDWGKVHRGMVGDLEILAGMVGWEWSYMEKLCVFGVVCSGWNIRVCRMAWVSKKVVGCTVGRAVRVLPVEGVLEMGGVWSLLEVLTRCRVAMEDVVGVVLEYRDGREV